MDNFKLPYDAPPTVLRGPGGITLTLDVTQVFPDDPGRGTPAIVEVPGRGTATYDCAVGEGEVDGGKGTYALTGAQLAWLDKQQQYVDEVWRQGKERDAIRKMRKERKG